MTISDNAYPKAVLFPTLLSQAVRDALGIPRLPLVAIFVDEYPFGARGPRRPVQVWRSAPDLRGMPER